MENSARLAGYTLTLVVLGTLMFLAAFLRQGNLFIKETTRVRFPSIGTLMEDDPVKLRGVEIGRVESIEAGDPGPIVTLEFYSREKRPRDARFINYNHSLFGARMVVMTPGASSIPMDPAEIQTGYFSTGVTESIHRMDELLRTALVYQDLFDRLDRGRDSSLSLRQLMETKVYPALDQVDRFAANLDTFARGTSASLEDLNRAAVHLQGLGQGMSRGTDTLLSQAQATLDKLSTLTAQTTVMLDGLEKMMVVSQDSSRLAGRLLSTRNLYDRTLAMTHALQDILKAAQKEGLKEIINFWRNVHFGNRKTSQ